MAIDKFSMPTFDNQARQKMAQPKRKDHFRIRLIGFGGEQFIEDTDLDLGGNLPVVSGEKAKAIELDVQSVSLPEISYEPHEVHSYNSKQYYKGKYTWGTLDVTVRDTIDNQAAMAVFEQLQKEFNHTHQESRTSANQYKFTMVIEQLDGTHSAQGTSASSAELPVGVLSRWTCNGCMIVNASFGDGLDYTTSDFITFNFTLQPDHCEFLIGASQANDTSM